MAHDWKVYQYVAEILIEPDGNARATQFAIEYINDEDTRFVRATQAIIEYVNDQSTRFVRATQFIIEVAMGNHPTPGGNPGDYLDEASAGDFSW